VKEIIRMKRCSPWIAACAELLSAVAVAQSMPPTKNADFPHFTQTQGDLDSDGLPTSGAKLCVLGRRDICYQMPSQPAHDSPEVIYQFGLDPRSERLRLVDGGSWVFFSGTFSGGGSGTLERIAVLRFEGNASAGKIVNLLPFVAITNAGERAIWKIPSASRYPILIRADFIWGKGESHFGAHYYLIDAWRFEPESNHYVRAFSYRTNGKYDAGDSGKPIHVLSSERQEIERRLEAK
jgi:hypothetical protein